MSSIVLECKRLCLLRCLKAVALSLGVQFILLMVFLYFVNMDVLHPFQWIGQTLGLLFSVYTWFSAIPLLAAVVLYGIVLGKSQLAVKKYYKSRFSWLKSTILRKVLFLAIHLLVGMLTAWLYTKFLHVDYRSLVYECYGQNCINGRYTFLICVGIAAGCYHFVKENLRQEPEVEYPIIQEAKLIKIRSLLYSTLYNSLLNSFVPSVSFAIVYWLLASVINRRVATVFYVELDDNQNTFLDIATDWRLIFYAWILSSQILSSMQLMQRFFAALLAEEMQFPIAKNPVLAPCRTDITLVDALAMDQVPVVQNLAACDLYNITTSKMAARRQEIFELSVPGCHPYNWNQLSGQCLSLINAFTEELAESVKSISAVKTTPLFATIQPTATDAAEKILLRQYNQTYGIRRMMADPTPTPTIGKPMNLSDPSNACQRMNGQLEHFTRHLDEVCHRAFRAIPGLYYMFGEPDAAKTVYLLSNSQIICWLCQGLAGICTASLVEDRYGVVQVVLPKIIKAMLNLKFELDKLNNVNLQGRKYDRNLISLKNAVKRSLYKICTVFGDYLPDLCTDQEDQRQLQAFANYQET